MLTPCADGRKLMPHQHICSNAKLMTSIHSAVLELPLPPSRRWM